MADRAHVGERRAPGDAVALRETRQYAELFSRVWHSLGEEFAKSRSE